MSEKSLVMFEATIVGETPNYLVCVSPDGPVYYQSKTSVSRGDKKERTHKPQGTAKPKPFKVAKKRMHADTELKSHGSYVKGDIVVEYWYATQLGIV